MNAPVARSPSHDVQPLLFIGLDGAEPDLIRGWIDEDLLPNLARLCRTGAWSDVRTLAGFGDGATWPTVISGVTPARHGRYFRRQFKPRSYRRTEFDVDTDLRHAPFWTTLGRAGRRVAVLDVPYARWEPDVNGVLLVDWLIHDRYGPVRSWPREFAREVIETLGDDPIGGDSDRAAKRDESLLSVCHHLRRRVGMKEALVTRTLRDSRWDLVATVFTEPHDIGHVGWHLHDPSHPRHDPAWLARHGDPLKTIYRDIDGAIGRIVDAASPGTAIVLFAGLGMGPNYTATNAMEQILARLDDRPLGSGRTLARRLTDAGLPWPVVRAGRVVDTIREVLDLRQRRFFAMPHNENSGAVRINLVGREPHGRVAPEEFDRVCDELTTAFLELRNPANGERIVERVVRVSREMTGARLDSMPDLLVEWHRTAPFDAVESPRIGRLEGVLPWARSGDHTSHALLVIHGGGIRPGRLPEMPTLVDIAATIAALQGVTLPDVEGRPICDVVRA